MKLVKPLLALVLSANVFAAQREFVPVAGVYSPKGFDTNDNSQVIIEGYLPNLCYKAPKAEFKQKGNSIQIEVKAIRDTNLEICPEMIVPFIEVVDLGILDRGKYNIVVNEKSISAQKSKLQVVESRSNATDNFAYANVDYIEKESGSRTIKLRGYNPSDCFVLDKVEFASNGSDTYSVLPEMKQVSDFCPMKMVPFSYEVEVPQNIKKSKVLLHVRVANGHSVNALFDNRIK